jgi:hypothetical protein
MMIGGVADPKAILGLAQKKKFPALVIFALLGCYAA